ncbi:MAG: hypothetical protein HY664_06455 [Chloroflexi bacterium]|nr:hypothetical protein [Chloroflexota bacterium]
MSETKVKVFSRTPSIVETPSNCPGCGYGIISRIVAEVLDELNVADQAVGVGGVGCCGGLFFSMNIDSFAPQAHGHSPSFATGVKRAHYGDVIVVTSQGDGDTMAIGPGSLINAAARGELITIIMTNNMNYGTTGGQMAPTTLIGQRTTTTPDGRNSKDHGWPIHTAELMAQIKGVAYSARGSVHNPANVTRTKRYFKTALEKQINKVGLSFIEILSMCPPDWRMEPVDACKFIQEKALAEYPLGEFINLDKIE